MLPEEAIKYINSVMSLRKPQLKSLELFSEYLKSNPGQLVLQRMIKDKRNNLDEILTQSKEYFSNIPEASEFVEFERKFPAFTFALATGVGKTRLMGAFVVYLYLVYNIQHFLIVAPNLTIYRKLKEDFSFPSNPKYVFKGIQEVNNSATKIISTDNYENYKQQSLYGNEIEISIFNIQQFAQKEMTAERGITKSSETLDESYFDYLKSHEDLVVMLDEAHHYHADAALGALDILDPLFGLEMTATPYINSKRKGRSSGFDKMKNVLYNFNLGDAIREKYVKDPWIGTEADVDFSEFEQDSIQTDARKLQLAAFFHERAKNALIEYAIENNKTIVKPVLLIVAKDITHAEKLKNLIDSDDFRVGAYKGKVLIIHTKLKGDEADDNIEQLISLEHPDNPIEIVIHVNMLKEGWDVTNVYTIAPIRESASSILTEQTIGRGLRLPYGERTGKPLVDRLVIVAHEQYSKVIELARDSELIQGHVEQISEKETKDIKTTISVQPVIHDIMKHEIEKNEVVMMEVSKKADEIVSKIPDIDNCDKNVKEKIYEGKKNEIVQTLTQEIFKNFSYSDYKSKETTEHKYLIVGSNPLFDSYSEVLNDELSEIATSSIRKAEIRNISIPRLIITPHYGELYIEDFNLDTNITALRTYTNEQAILEEQLQMNKEKDLFGDEVPGRRVTEITRVSSFGSQKRQSPQSTIIAALISYPLIDYDDENQKPLLLKLADQAVNYFNKKAKDIDNLSLMIETNARTIAEDIYKQILSHKELRFESYLESDVRGPKPFLEQYNISVSVTEEAVSLNSQVNTFSAKFVYGFFQKACHSMYKFDSSDEVRFAYLLERDETVKVWLRPAPNQFEGLYWRDEQGDSQHLYEPDFVVELENEILMVEVKPENEFNYPEVKAKRQTAEKYCQIVNKNLGNYGINKPWRYIILSTDKIKIQSTIGELLR